MPVLWSNIRKDIKERPCFCGKLVRRKDESTLSFYRGEFRLLHDTCYAAKMKEIIWLPGDPPLQEEAS